MSDDVKTRILNAAKHLFALQGYAATSVRQICEEAGANVALVSYHFGGKERLLLALLEQLFPSQDEYGVIDRMTDPIQKLKALLSTFIIEMNKNREVGRIIQMEYLLQTDRVEILREYAFPLWTRWRAALSEARAEGRLQFDSLDAAMLQSMGAMIYPLTDIFVSPLLEEGSYSLEEQIEQRTHFILRGLGADASEFAGIVWLEKGQH